MPTVPCSKCEDGQVFYGSHRDPPTKPVCSKCYIPRNPTDGWMLNKCLTNPDFSELLFRQMNPKKQGDGGLNAKQKRYLRDTLKSMGIKILTKKQQKEEEETFKPDR